MGQPVPLEPGNKVSGTIRGGIEPGLDPRTIAGKLSPMTGVPHPHAGGGTVFGGQAGQPAALHQPAGGPHGAQYVGGGQPAGPGSPSHGQPVAVPDPDGDQNRNATDLRKPRAGYLPSLLADVTDAGAQVRMPRTGRVDPENPVELFMFFLFPLGYERLADDAPARQLPAPPEELDLAAGLRFPPGDHPRADLVDSGAALAAITAGREPVLLPAGQPADSPAVWALIEDHDPLGGEHEQDWARRFLVRQAMSGPDEHEVHAEYAWPPVEAFPEGACAPDTAEAVVLEPGTVIDRFGDPTGVVLAADGTSFGQRSLPPEYAGHGYHRYEVNQPLPAWRAVSAAWFGQPGGGIRYRTTYPVLDLVALGYLTPLTQDPDGSTA